MRRTSIILTSLVALGLAGSAGATTTKPMAAPNKTVAAKVAKVQVKANAKTTKMSAKAEAKQDRIEAKAEAKQDRLQAKAARRHHKVAKLHRSKVKVASHAVKTTAKPAATHG